MISALIELLKNLPALIELIKQLQKKQNEAAVKMKIKYDLKKINQAFKDKDEQALRNIFNS